LKTNISIQKRPLQVVFFLCFITSIVSALYCYSEWFVVEKLNQIDSYNFGNTSGRAYYFQSKVLYAFIHLFWGVCFTISTGLMLISFVFKAKWYKVVSLIIAILIIGIYVTHWILA
jgi:hypothetical protein